MGTPTLDKLGGNVDWNDVVGMDWFDTFTVDDPEAGVPFDLTGATVAAGIYTKPHAAGTLVAAFTVTYPDRAAGVFTVTVDKSVTATVAAGSYYWACAILDSSGNRVRWMYGRFTAVDGVPV